MDNLRKFCGWLITPEEPFSHEALTWRVPFMVGMFIGAIATLATVRWLA